MINFKITHEYDGILYVYETYYGKYDAFFDNGYETAILYRINPSALSIVHYTRDKGWQDKFYLQDDYNDRLTLDEIKAVILLDEI